MLQLDISGGTLPGGVMVRAAVRIGSSAAFAGRVVAAPTLNAVVRASNVALAVARLRFDSSATRF